MRLFRHIHNDLRRTFAERIDIFHRNRYGNLLHQFQITAFDYRKNMTLRIELHTAVGDGNHRLAIFDGCGYRRIGILRICRTIEYIHVIDRLQCKQRSDIQRYIFIDFGDEFSGFDRNRRVSDRISDRYGKGLRLAPRRRYPNRASHP